MDGLLLINKPRGPSSFDVIRTVRRITGQKKVGHAGTLDPLASGLLLVLFGAACKQAEKFSKLNKDYTFTVELGKTSTTDDSEGEINKVSDKKPIKAEIDQVLKRFIGQIKQIPPQYSAIKVKGQRAYRLARKGYSLELEPREITIYRLNCIKYRYPKLSIEAKVSSGTYIRSLARDIGQCLRTGAYVSQLERVSVGKFKLEGAVELNRLSQEKIAQNLILEL